VRWISRVIPLIIAATVGMGAGVGIGMVAASHGPKQARHPAAAAATSHVASSAQWAAEGATLIQGVLTNGKATYNSSYKNGNWAYESVPIEVTKNGDYLVDFGPVPVSFDYPAHPKGIAFDWPPDAAFSIYANGSRTVTLGGRRFFQVGITVSGLSRPYESFRAWIY
jgi:ABC-type phosphate transport system substrate-binding protein